MFNDLSVRRFFCAATPVVVIATALGLGSGCGRVEPARSKTGNATPSFKPAPLVAQAVGNPLEGKPWIPHVNATDLDRDGLVDVIVCEGQKNLVAWIRQTRRGEFEEQVLMTGIQGPVHTEAVDMDADGDLDLLVASMGVIFPNNDKIGSVIILENDGHQRFTRRVIVDKIARVTDVRAGDFNRDGRPDLAVAQFGYDQGEIRWMENLGNWEFKSTLLLNLSGSIHVLVADMNGDRTLDIAALVSQEWEEIVLFQNDGSGTFTNRVIFGSTNEDFGSSGIALCDLNRDGKPDIVYTNGDGFDYADPGGRPWHGAQWLENVGNGFFRQHRIGDLAGAYSPVVMDYDGDGAMDVIAVSGFNDWASPRAVSIMLFRNDGQMRFTAHPLARKPTHLMCASAGDLDGNGSEVLVTGGFHAYPPHDSMSRVTLWRRTK